MKKYEVDSVGREVCRCMSDAAVMKHAALRSSPWSLLVIVYNRGLVAFLQWGRAPAPLVFRHKVALQQEEQGHCDKTTGKGVK